MAAIVLTTWIYDCEVVSGVSTYAGDLVGTFLAVSRHWGSLPSLKDREVGGRKAFFNHVTE